ncbi:uncharacterized protein LOC126654565 isoform X2 [Mercurialis annua]|nr:uncharacterized protein LOC126654565 isoform X2 [Mercurialis annua]
MEVCQKCGDRGSIKQLVYCVKCEVSAEHSYCLDMLPSEGDENAPWKCEECCPRYVKRSPTRFLKSARISQAVEIRLNRIKMRKQASFSKVYAHVNKGADVEEPTGDCFPQKKIEMLPHVNKDADVREPTGDCSPNKEIVMLPSSRDGSPLKEFERHPASSPSLGKEEFKKRKRRLVLDDGNSDEEFELIKQSEVSPPHLNPSVGDHSPEIVHMSYSEASNYLHAEPRSDPIWRGGLSIRNEKSPAIELVAHLSSKACGKAGDAAKQLPLQLNMSFFSKSDVWPQQFERAPPSDDHIALYFFPANERDEKVFDNLINHIITHDQALQTTANKVELLIFSSRELPPDHWRFCLKYYLWGVFKPTKKALPDISVPNFQ